MKKFITKALECRFYISDRHWNLKPMTKLLKTYIFMSASVIGVMLFFVTTKTVVINKVKYIPQETKILIIRDNNKFTPKKFYAELKRYRLKYPDIVFAQSYLETSHFTSHLFRANNNLFGMKLAGKRPAIFVREEYGHAYYDSWRESVQDYALFEAAFLNDLRTREEFMSYIGSHYAKQPDYRQRVESVIKKLKNSKILK